MNDEASSISLMRQEQSCNSQNLDTERCLLLENLLTSQAPSIAVFQAIIDLVSDGKLKQPNPFRKEHCEAIIGFYLASLSDKNIGVITRLIYLLTSFRKAKLQQYFIPLANTNVLELISQTKNEYITSSHLSILTNIAAFYSLPNIQPILSLAFMSRNLISYRLIFVLSRNQPDNLSEFLGSIVEYLSVFQEDQDTEQLRIYSLLCLCVQYNDLVYVYVNTFDQCIGQSLRSSQPSVCFAALSLLNTILSYYNADQNDLFGKIDFQLIFSLAQSDLIDLQKESLLVIHTAFLDGLFQLTPIMNQPEFVNFITTVILDGTYETKIQAAYIFQEFLNCQKTNPQEITCTPAYEEVVNLLPCCIREHQNKVLKYLHSGLNNSNAVFYLEHCYISILEDLDNSTEEFFMLKSLLIQSCYQINNS